MGTLSYNGKKATDYDAKREGTKKWQRENDAVESLIPDDVTTVIDIPCGTGRFIPLYRKLGLNWACYDVSSDMILMAQSKFKAGGFYIGDIRKLPANLTNTFDLAVCCRLTGWLNPSDLELAVKELLRVAKVAIIGIRVVYQDQPIQKGRLWIHSSWHFAKILESSGAHIDQSFEFGCKGDIEYKFVRVTSDEN